MSAAEQLTLNGATRLHFIVGDPIAQVKSPAGVSQAFQDAGRNALCVPAHVAPADLDNWAKGVSLGKNVDGIIVTVPHKFAAFGLCASTSPRAAFLGAVNTMRRNHDGTWHGDMFDGEGYVRALRQKGCEPRGLRALLVGAGGAGTAIALALAQAGVNELALHDSDQARRDALMTRLGKAMGASANASQHTRLTVGSTDPRGFDLVLNATPVGMQAGDPHPLDSQHFSPAQFVGCVITAPAVTPMIATARSLGCTTVTGADMFAQVKDLMVEFLMGA